MSERIQHTATVERVEANQLTVRIVQTSACAACGARGLCHAAESKEKQIDIVTPDAHTFIPGQTVIVEGTTSGGMKAVRLAFLYPLALLTAVIVVLSQLTPLSEPVCSLAAIGTTLAWYVGLSFFKDKLRREFAFHIVDEG